MATLIEAGHRAPPVAAWLIADAPHAAHRADVVHRDDTPGDILVRSRNPAVALVDVGTARAVGATARTTARSRTRRPGVSRAAVPAARRGRWVSAGR